MENISDTRGCLRRFMKISQGVANFIFLSFARLAKFILLSFARLVKFRNGAIHSSQPCSLSCSFHRVSSVILNNGSALNVCPLATAIALGYAPSNFGPSTQTIRPYDSTRRKVMGTLEIELLIGLTTFPTLFQVLRIPTSFNLLLGRPWIHRVEAIPFSLHQKVKFICDGQERVRARLTHTPFDYPIPPYTMSLADYFVRASELQSHPDGNIGGLSTVQEAELQHLIH
ncbi:hypothetical protein CK203_059369 [Vitis vinifera]|uniref:Uncharacterized protein n=1 Tax=Vitis vinifera TaxID=29760 RepID=A0A438GBF6_VITVI|nr:hypothetical protein CK203_059369 [Vitis vinifera]